MIIQVLLELLVFRLLFKKRGTITVPITIVDHKDHGVWEFFSGSYLTKIRVTSIDEAVEHDATIRELRNLPIGYSAKRTDTDAPWKTYKTAEASSSFV